MGMLNVAGEGTSNDSGMVYALLVRACVRACVRARVRARACVYVRVYSGFGRGCSESVGV